MSTKLKEKFLKIPVKVTEESTMQIPIPSYRKDDNGLERIFVYVESEERSIYVRESKFSNDITVMAGHSSPEVLQNTVAATKEEFLNAFERVNLSFEFLYAQLSGELARVANDFKHMASIEEGSDLPFLAGKEDF